MSEIDVESAYRQRYERSLKALAIRLEAHLCDLFDEVNHIDRISARAKDPRRFAEKAGKAENGRPKYMHPFEEIQDQVGARITVLYESDVPVVEEVLVRYFHPVENLQRAPEDSASFGQTKLSQRTYLNSSRSRSRRPFNMPGRKRIMTSRTSRMPI